jgi:DNA gyrase/topoisomerase IV subunit B
LFSAVNRKNKINVENEKVLVKKVLDDYVKSIEDEDMNLYSEIVAHDSIMINVGGSVNLSWIDGWEKRGIFINRDRCNKSTNIYFPDW